MAKVTMPILNLLEHSRCRTKLRIAISSYVGLATTVGFNLGKLSKH
jgi:hypothetical protein